MAVLEHYTHIPCFSGLILEGNTRCCACAAAAMVGAADCDVTMWGCDCGGTGTAGAEGIFTRGGRVADVQ